MVPKQAMEFVIYDWSLCSTYSSSKNSCHNKTPKPEWHIFDFKFQNNSPIDFFAVTMVSTCFCVSVSEWQEPSGRAPASHRALPSRWVLHSRQPRILKPKSLDVLSWWVDSCQDLHPMFIYPRWMLPVWNLQLITHTFKMQNQLGKIIHSPLACFYTIK